jgi:hypothetical protein
MAALHNDWLFVAQYGSTETTLISSDQYEEFGTSEGQSETLGQSKRIQPRFYQSGIKPGDLILMNGNPPTSWNSYYLAGSAALSMSQVKQRLLNQVTGNLETIVIKCAEGSGQISTHTWSEVEADLPVKAINGSDPLNMTTESEKSISGNKLDLKLLINEVPGSPDRSIDPSSLNKTLKRSILAAVMFGGRRRNRKARYPVDETKRDRPEKATNSAVMSLARAWMNAKTFNAKSGRV